MADDEVKTDSAEVETPVNHVNSMVNSLVDGDNVAAQDAFKNALTDKIGQALDDKRKDIAGTILSKPVETKKDDTNAEEPVEIDN